MELLLETGVAIDAVDALKYTALHHAAFYGRAEVTRLLISRGPI